MRDPPETAALLRLAEDCAGTPEAARVRAIARRESQGDTAYVPIRAALQRLYGDAPDADLLRRLAADIRAGRADRPEIAQLLWAHAEQRLRENNPRFLWEREAPGSRSCD